MPNTMAVSLTKWSLDVLTKLIKADVRLHNAERIEDDMAVIFTVNHFTRLETILLPYMLYKHTGRTIMSLAADELFGGAVGEFLASNGAISTEAPDRDKTIVRALLQGEHPWMIFPEGAMIKDKKVLDGKGGFEVYHKGERRPPHHGAAVLALRAEFYRRKIECLSNRPNQVGLEAALDNFGVESAEEVLTHRTVIVPVNITYFPIRARENVVLRLANRIKDDLSPRALEELSVEGTVLSSDTDIDITLGKPIPVMEYLEAPEYAELLACSLQDMHHFDTDPSTLFEDAAEKLMQRYMRSIYDLVTINHDHLFATLLRHQRHRRSSERFYRNRIYLCAQEMRALGRYRFHTLLDKHFGDVVSDDPSPAFEDFLALCLKEGVLESDGAEVEPVYTKQKRAEERADFQVIRASEATEVIANELEPLSEAAEIVRRLARTPNWVVAKRVRDTLWKKDLERFETDYARFYDPEQSKSPDVGRPFLLRPRRVRAGMVLSHGYMAAPQEVRAMADYFCERGYAVYGVRLPGHGTVPEDLAQVRWESWYEAFSRGYAVLKNLSDHVVAGGFSTGGCLALIAAARKKRKIDAVFSISAPLKLQNYSVRLAPSAVNLNTLLKKMGGHWDKLDYVDNRSEHPEVNYIRNPLTGVGQLVKTMDAMEKALPDVMAPTLIVQGSKDSLVNPVSGTLIFDKLGAPRKELSVFERENHGIVNGPGSQEIFERIDAFLKSVNRSASDPTAEETKEESA
jgi:esterase/lipase/1-acyl-sn-glycerol-3-phosphate acyltransferase